MSQPGNSPASRDIAYVMHGYTDHEAHKLQGPHILQSGKGIYVYDDTGKEFIEGMAGLWCTSLGYGEERLINAATEQLKKLAYSHLFAGKSHDPVIDLAERLIEMAPVPMSKVFFNNSGSEGNDTVVKLVWYYNNAVGRPEKKKIISRIKGYHGVTIASASLTGLPNNHRDFDLPIANIMHTSCPHYYRFGQDGESEEEFATRCAAELEAMIMEEGPETVAAFIAEPVMGAGGVIIPPKTYFEKIQAVLKKHDVLFIADEVICGFGRTGSMWGCQTYDLKPDMITCAKALSSAYLPISAVLINEKVSDAIVKNSGKIGTLGHGYTYMGHPVAAAVALETLNIYQERDIIGHIDAIAPVMQKRLQSYADHPLVGEVRGVGLVGAVELVKDKATKEMFDPAGKVGAYLVDRAKDHGLILRNIADAIAFSPPLIISAKEMESVFDRFDKALEETVTFAAGL
jgi:4-aminobutyrate--pyruvate transaminase